MNKVFIAFYHGKRDAGDGSKIYNFYAQLMDNLTRLITRGKFSHCEVAVKQDDGSYVIYSSSVRDKGVRKKVIKDLPSRKWELVEVDCTLDQIEAYYQANEGKSYDWLGAIGVVIRIIKQRSNKLFCSEYCSETLGYKEGWRFSPNDLYFILTKE